MFHAVGHFTQISITNSIHNQPLYIDIWIESRKIRKRKHGLLETNKAPWYFCKRVIIHAGVSKLSIPTMSSQKYLKLDQVWALEKGKHLFLSIAMVTMVYPSEHACLICHHCLVQSLLTTQSSLSFRIYIILSTEKVHGFSITMQRF